MMNLKPILLSIFLITFMSVATITHAQVSESVIIDAKIKISVCGDGAIEYPEDCENADLNSNTCESLDFASGTLTCDTACSFDTTACIPLPDESEDTPSDDKEVDSKDNDTSTKTETNIITQIIETIIQTDNSGVTPRQLPQTFEIFGVDQDEVITKDELESAVQIWVDEWKKALEIELANGGIQEPENIGKCDLNTDNTCNVRDFSLLMYYVDR